MRDFVILYGSIFSFVFSITRSLDYSEDPYQQELGSSWFPNNLENEEDQSKAVQELVEFFGINQENVDKLRDPKTVPRFMEELYNEVADTETGFVKGKTLYDAQIIRSFFEKAVSKNDIFHFEISNIPMDEFILQAELHLFKTKMSMERMHPSILTSPYHLIRVYQVMDNLSLDVPDFHKLLNVQYVNAHSSGWQIFNVKQAVISWMNGEPNLGLMVIGSTLFEDSIEIEFIRKTEHQPILVLFNNIIHNEITNYLDKETIEDTPQQIRDPNLSRSKRDPNKQLKKIIQNKIISGRSKLEDILTSMNIYERGIFREILQSKTKVIPAIRRKRIMQNRKLRYVRNAMNCTRRDFRIDFDELGLSSFIILPKVYAVYQCKGYCQYVSGNKVDISTNHAIVQNIMHKIKLRENDIGLPCCVPIKLLDLALLYFDQKDQIVLKIYTDMVVDTCGCR